MTNNEDENYRWEVESMTVHIKLYGEKADRFEAIKAEMSEKMGYEPTNPEIVGLLLARYNETSNDK